MNGGLLATLFLDTGNATEMDSVELGRIGQYLGWRARRISAPLRALPAFLIIGAMKSGTSSLFHYLAQHPQLIPAKKKEVHYFDGGAGAAAGQEHGTSLNWYRSHFPLRWMMPRLSMTYEATPMYFCHRSAPRHIHEAIPDARLILMLRNPSERAISHYFHTKRNRPGPDILHATMAEEVERLSSGQGPGSKEPDYTSYVARGLYQQQLEIYLSYFERRSLFVVNSEEFFEDPHSIFPRLFQFLGIQTDSPIGDLTVRNVSPRRMHVWPQTRALLDDFFRPHNEQLFSFLGERYDWNPAD